MAKQAEKKTDKKSGKAKWIIGGVAVFLVVQWCFIGWQFSFGPFKGLGRIRMRGMPGNADQYSFSGIEKMENSPLEGKTVLFLGSSVTNGEAALQNAIPEYFAARMGCAVIREAVDGTTLTDNGKSSYVQRLLNNVDPNSKVDLMICQLSTNDATKKMPLGDIGEGTDKTSFDTSTITGAMEFINAYARETWDCPVVFYTNARFDDPDYPAMVERVHALVGKWGIGVLDLWTDEAFNAISDAERSLYMKDNIHPYMAGYRDWWGPELERQLIGYLEKE